MTSPLDWRPHHLGTSTSRWIAGDPTITLVSGKVSVWPDRSSNARDALQGTSGKRPTPVTNTVNGQPVIRFVAANSTNTLTAAFTSVAHPITFWVVLKLTVQTGTPTPFYTYVGGGVGDALYAPDGSNVNLYGNTLTISAAFNMTSAFATYVAIFNTASSSLRINGTQVASGTLAHSNFTQIGIGSIEPVASSQYIDGDVAELGFVPLALSGAKLSLLETYLRRRYKTW